MKDSIHESIIFSQLKNKTNLFNERTHTESSRTSKQIERS